MKTLVMKSPGVVVPENRDMPVPKTGELLLKVTQVGVCGTDLHAFEGTQPFYSYPRIPGHEIACVVAGVPRGTDAGGLKEGDAAAVLPYLSCGSCAPCGQGKTNCCVDLKVLGVHIDGGFAEYLVVPAGYAVPAGRVAADDIALVECFAIGFHGVRRAMPAAGETALVVGAGPIGIGVIHGLKQRGVRVIVMDINEKRLAYARDTAKADCCINSGTAGVEPEKAVAEYNNGALPQLVMDATGNAGQMMKAFGYVGAGGRIVFVGLVRQDISFSDPVLHAKELTVMASRNATKTDFAAVITALESGNVDTRGFVTHRVSLDDAPRGFPEWLKSESGCIKAVVTL